MPRFALYKGLPRPNNLAASIFGGQNLCCRLSEVIGNLDGRLAFGVYDFATRGGIDLAWPSRIQTYIGQTGCYGFLYDIAACILPTGK